MVGANVSLQPDASSFVSAMTAVASTRPIRPCMVSFYFHPDYSGSAIQALNLSSHLRRLGMSPMIVSANLSGSSAHESFDGVPVYRVPVASSPNAQIPSFWLSAARFLWKRRDDFDLIHAHGTVQHGVVSLLGRLVHKPTILKVAMADSDLAFSRQGRVFGGLNRFMVSRFDRYIATTETIAAEFEERSLDAGRVRLIPNGVDTEVFAPVQGSRRTELKRELGLPAGPLVSCVAVVNARKNIDGILRVWKQAVKQGAKGHVAIIGPVTGEDPYYRSLCDFVESHGLQQRVCFLGKRAPVAPYLQASDVFMFPSKREGMPNAVIEAMSCGLPCLVSESSGAAGLIRDGVSGYLLEASDERGFAERLLTLLQDEDLRARVGGAAREHISASLSLQSIAVRYQAVYEELLECQAGGC